MSKKTDPVTYTNSDFNPLVTFQEEIDTNLKKLKVSEIKIIFFGSRDFVIPVAEALNDHFYLQAIVTVADKEVGRGYELTPTPVKNHFLKTKIQVFDPAKLDNEFLEVLKSLEADLFVVAAYGQFLPDEFLNIPEYGVLNLHPSLLPKYRGPSPIQNAILNGDKETGMSFMLLDEKMDHGPIIYQFRFDISDQDTFESLGKNIFQKASEEVVGVIEHFVKGKLKPAPQDDAKATFTKLIKKEDGFFEIDNPPSPEQLNRMIRAYYPWPNAWTRWNGKVVKFLPDKLVQMEGKKPVKLKDFLNGYPEFPIKDLN